MTAQILILEPNEKQAARLVSILDKAADEYTPTVVKNVKEACMLLIQQPHDMALIPVQDGDKILRALRALQPDLRVVVLTPAGDTAVPRRFSGLVQGVLIRSLAPVDLLPVVVRAFAEPMVVESDGKQAAGQTGPLFGAALVDVDLGDVVKTAVVSRGPSLLTYAGELNEMQAAMVAQRVGADWRTDGPTTARLQFVQLPARSGDLLLYTSLLADRYLLTLAADPDTSLAQLRQNCRRLTEVLTQMITSSETGAAANGNGAGIVYGRASYAIVWQPVKPLPENVQIPLRRAMVRLAEENNCIMVSVDVGANLVHLVVACPPGRDSVWAAYLFKNGSEAIIQEQYNVSAQLWETGFYAVEATEPLSEAELNIFLERK